MCIMCIMAVLADPGLWWLSVTVSDLGDSGHSAIRTGSLHCLALVTASTGYKLKYGENYHAFNAFHVLVHQFLHRALIWTLQHWILRKHWKSSVSHDCSCAYLFGKPNQKVGCVHGARWLVIQQRPVSGCPVFLQCRPRSLLRMLSVNRPTGVGIVGLTC